LGKNACRRGEGLRSVDLWRKVGGARGETKRGFSTGTGMEGTPEKGLGPKKGVQPGEREPPKASSGSISLTGGFKKKQPKAPGGNLLGKSP